MISRDRKKIAKTSVFFGRGRKKNCSVNSLSNFLKIYKHEENNTGIKI
jgi:hypothetical protein